MTLSSAKKDYIDYLKAFAIIMVVSVHAFTYYSGHHGPLSTIWKNIWILMRTVCVPLFFAVAGFLCHKQKVLPFYRKKVFRILLPFLTFTTLKLVYTNCVSNHFAHANTLWFQLIDAFIYGELYWFCYPIL